MPPFIDQGNNIDLRIGSRPLQKCMGEMTHLLSRRATAVTPVTIPETHVIIAIATTDMIGTLTGIVKIVIKSEKGNANANESESESESANESESESENESENERENENTKKKKIIDIRTNMIIEGHIIILALRHTTRLREAVTALAPVRVLATQTPTTAIKLHH
jgi:hypothetical protein